MISNVQDEFQNVLDITIWSVSNIFLISSLNRVFVAQVLKSIIAEFRGEAPFPRRRESKWQFSAFQGRRVQKSPIDISDEEKIEIRQITLPRIAFDYDDGWNLRWSIHRWYKHISTGRGGRVSDGLIFKFEKSDLIFREVTRWSIIIDNIWLFTISVYDTMKPTFVCTYSLND